MADKPVKNERAAAGTKDRVFEALVGHLDSVDNEDAKVSFLYSIGISDEKDVDALLGRSNKDDKS